MRLLYSFFILLYGIGIRIAAFFHPKAKSWVEGRGNLFARLAVDFNNNNSPVFWIHCASLGEFEQGRPLIETYRIKHPEHKILLTFFSPSGYAIRKDYQGADWVYYLPLDTSSNAEKFISIVRPTLAVFVKYEYWFNFLEALKNKDIPSYYISAILRPNHYFFSWYGKWALKQLKNVTHFFVQTKESGELLQNHGIAQYTFTGDTRFDRVIQVFEGRKELPELSQFCDQQPCIVAGSTWSKDENLLVDLLQKNEAFASLKLILAPHEINPANVRAVQEKFKDLGVQLYSTYSKHPTGNFRVLIIDNIGMLSSLYYYAHYCYVGGGFGKGIHNILEAAVYGKPLFFGPNYQKFDEAKKLIDLGGASSVTDANGLRDELFLLMRDEKKYRERCQVSYQFVRGNSGAVQKILSAL